MTDFDTPIDRLNTGSNKWSKYPADVLPMWVADMDFAVAPPIVAALQQRIAHPVFGYAVARPALREQIVASMAADYDWNIAPEDIVFLPGVEPGFNMALKAMLKPGDGVIVQTPVYKPLLSAAAFWGLRRIDLEIRVDEYRTDMPAFRHATKEAGAFLFCNPQNPLGKVFDRAELTELAAACLASNTLIISDEIHCDLAFDGRRHVPMASLSREIEQNTITLMAASKTYNISGLKTAFAIIPNQAIRERVDGARLGMVDSVNLMGLEATLAAYAECGEWRRELIQYLQANRDWLFDAVRTRLPGVTMHKPEGTFLAWLDCSGLDLQQNPQQFFLEHARVGLSDGEDFGAPGKDFVRLNYGCTRATLEEGIRRMQASLKNRRG